MSIRMPAAAPPAAWPPRRWPAPAGRRSMAAGCSSEPGVHRRGRFEQHDRGRRRGERVRQRDQPDRRQVRARDRDREQPEHRPAQRSRPARAWPSWSAAPAWWCRTASATTSYMNKIESAAPNAHRKVIDVQNLLGLPDSTPNPHLWYKPATMPAVAKAVASDLASMQPSHASVLPGPDLRRVRHVAAALVPGARHSSRPPTRARRWRSPSRSATTCCRRPAPGS